MKTETYTVLVDILETDEGKVFTAQIAEIKGAIVQSDTLSKAFIELGIHLHVIKELKKDESTNLDGRT